MKTLSNRIIWGVLLVIAGIAFLMQNLGVIQFGGSIFAILFLLGGAAFLSVLISNREQWWAIFPGVVLVDIGLLILADAYAPRFSDQFGGTLFLGGLSLCFWIVYLLQPQMWWAIIPGGVMLTLAVIAWLGNVFSGFETGGIFFLGLGLTFALLSAIRTPQGRMRWALIPAGVLLLMGIILGALSSSLFNYIWAIGLIAAGVFLFFYRRPNRE